jgi:methylenetetrahydrofolate reductase (NADH)
MNPERDALAKLLARPRYEVFPVERIAGHIVAHVPTEITVAVTSSPTRGIEATLRLCEELGQSGFRVSPHLAARAVRDERHLQDILERLAVAGVRDVFVIAGDVDVPGGEVQRRGRAPRGYGRARP